MAGASLHSITKCATLLLASLGAAAEGAESVKPNRVKDSPGAISGSLEGEMLPRHHGPGQAVPLRNLPSIGAVAPNKYQRGGLSDDSSPQPKMTTPQQADVSPSPYHLPPESDLRLPPHRHPDRYIPDPGSRIANHPETKHHIPTIQPKGKPAVQVVNPRAVKSRHLLSPGLPQAHGVHPCDPARLADRGR